MNEKILPEPAEKVSGNNAIYCDCFEETLKYFVSIFILRHDNRKAYACVTGFQLS